MTPAPGRFLAAMAATWPPASQRRLGPWTIRDGAGGGQRVSAATAEGPVTAADLPAAEAAMRDLGQRPLFMVRAGETALDALLAGAGHAVVDAVDVHAAPVADLAARKPPPVTAFTIWEPLAVMVDIWEAGGIGAARRAVMARAPHPKTGILGRIDDSPACAGFVAIHQDVAVVHALEVTPRSRRKGMGGYAIRQAAIWAQEHGATRLAAACTRDNAAARALYSSLGMGIVEHYHYRQKP
ncbi:GNAT family N-acetyltransferase [Roseovarius salinarum]|uniref:GNAT family N-acetyltransferase n=1 Tax=Roseovarius salinarum TaxID=1981892 RepID=UPI000C337238|nr:GNAT family N-acetyltransferase [Roseovarius salinarum]